METKKIINLLNDSSNEEFKFATKISKFESKLESKFGMSQTVKQQKVNTSNAIILNLKQKLLNEVFLIILMHLF